MTEDEIRKQAWLAELRARPRSEADLAFWQEHRSRPGGGRELLHTLSFEYLVDLHRLTPSPGFRAALWRELRKRQFRRLLGKRGVLVRTWRKIFG